MRFIQGSVFNHAARISLQGVCVLVYLCLVTSLRAQLWDGGGTNDNWSTSTNWAGDVTPANNGTALLIFGGTTRLTPNVGVAWNVLGIVFTNTAGAFTVGGSSTVTVQGSGIINKDTDTQTINAPLKLGSAASIDASVGDLVLGGALNNNGKTLTLTGSGNLTLSGVLSGSGDLIKSGTGTATLSGTSANSLGGAAYVNGGILLLNKTAGLDALDVATTVGDGIGGAQADILRLNANNQIQDGVNVVIGSSGLLDLNGYDDKVKVTSIEGGAITTGNGTLTLAANVTTVATNQTATISGKVNLGANRDFTVNDGAASIDLSVSAVTSGAYELEKKGSGTLLLSGANTHSGGTKLTAGTLAIGHSNALGSGTFTIAQNTVIYAQGGALILTNAVSSAGNATIGGDQDLTFRGAWSATADSTFTVTNTGLTTIAGGVSGNHKFSKEGAGTLVLSGTNDFTETYINAGVVRILNGKSLDGTDKRTEVAVGAALELQGGITVGAEEVKIGGTGISNGGALRNVSGNNVWGGIVTTEFGNTTIASDSGTLTILGELDNKGYTSTFAGLGNIALNGNVKGTGGLIKNGAGTLTLNAATAFTGSLVLNAGTLLYGANNVIVNTVNATLNGATFNTGGYNDALGTLTLTADSIIDFSSGSSVLSFANSSAISWTGGAILTLTNWSGSWQGGGNDQLIFGSTSSGLTDGQLAQIRFWDTDGGRYMKAGILASGEIVPVPEPSTLAGAFVLIALACCKERRRLVKIWQAGLARVAFRRR